MLFWSLGGVEAGAQDQDHLGAPAGAKGALGELEPRRAIWGAHERLRAAHPGAGSGGEHDADGVTADGMPADGALANDALFCAIRVAHVGIVWSKDGRERG